MRSAVSFVRPALIALSGTLLLYLILGYFAYNPSGGVARFDVARFEKLPEPSDSSILALDPIALAVWLALVGLLSYFVVWFAARGQDVRMPRLLKGAGLLTILSAAYLAVVHPAFLMAIGHLAAVELFFERVVPRVPPLERLYFHSGFMSYLPWIVFGHAALTALVILFTLRHDRSVDQ